MNNSNQFFQALFQYRRSMTPAQRIRTAHPTVPLSSYPWAIERTYAKFLSNLFKRLTDGVADAVDISMETILRGDTRQDAIPGGAFRSFINVIKKLLSVLFPDNTTQVASDAIQNLIDTLFGINKTADTVKDFADRQWSKQSKKVLGTSYISSAAWWPAVKANWAAQNYELIRGNASAYISRINDLVETAVLNRWTVEELTDEIKKISDQLTDGKARLLARDQIGKLNGQITQATHEEMGLDVYFWNTMQDERVRKPTHTSMQSKLCKYSDPSVYSTDGKTWKSRTTSMIHLHPGQDIQCRCTATPWFDDAIKTVDAQISERNVA